MNTDFMHLLKKMAAVVFYVGVMFLPFLAQAEETLLKIIESGVLRVGMTVNQPPFCMRSKKGEVVGLDVDLSQMLAKSMGVELRIVELPFAKLLPALEDGEIDAVISGMTITPKRNLIADFAGPYILAGKSVLAKKSSVANASDAKLNNEKFTFIALEHGTSEMYVKNVLPEANLMVTEDYDAAMDLIKEGKADALIADHNVCIALQSQYPELEMEYSVRYLAVEPIGIALPRNDHQFLNLVDNYIETLKIGGWFDLLEQQWFEDKKWFDYMHLDGE